MLYFLLTNGDSLQIPSTRYPFLVLVKSSISIEFFSQMLNFGSSHIYRKIQKTSRYEGARGMLSLVMSEKLYKLLHI
jgi:hypothetical protein